MNNANEQAHKPNNNKNRNHSRLVPTTMSSRRHCRPYRMLCFQELSYVQMSLGVLVTNSLCLSRDADVELVQDKVELTPASPRNSAGDLLSVDRDRHSLRSSPSKLLSQTNIQHAPSRRGVRPIFRTHAAQYSVKQSMTMTSTVL